MQRNYAKLLGKMKECGYTQERLALEIDRDKSTLNAKFKGKSDFTAKEINLICIALGIDNSEIGLYFFA